MIARKDRLVLCENCIAFTYYFVVQFVARSQLSGGCSQLAEQVIIFFFIYHMGVPK